MIDIDKITAEAREIQRNLKAAKEAAKKAEADNKTELDDINAALSKAEEAAANALLSDDEKTYQKIQSRIFKLKVKAERLKAACDDNFDELYSKSVQRLTDLKKELEAARWEELTTALKNAAQRDYSIYSAIKSLSVGGVNLGEVPQTPDYMKVLNLHQIGISACDEYTMIIPGCGIQIYEHGRVK